MKKRTELPAAGLVAWYVGAGDSLTIITGQKGDGAELILQVDLNHMTLGEDGDEPAVPIIDQLVEILPRVDDEPYLAAFALTHPDEDHCRGFARLLEEVQIGELWATPRIFDEYKTELSDDATAFREEADRRVAEMDKGGAASGDRIRVVGAEDLFGSEPYDSLPDEARSQIGSSTSVLDGWDAGDAFLATFHGPNDVADTTDRNDTSLAMGVTLVADGCEQRALLLGDSAHGGLCDVLGQAGDDELEFDILVAPHHCSKRALFDDDGNEVTEVTSGLSDAAADDAWVVASSPPIPASDSDGADPPHRLAWDKYEALFGADRQVCTGEHGGQEDPDPVIFGVGSHDCGYVKPSTGTAVSKSALIGASETARPRPRPTDRRGYGAARE